MKRKETEEVHKLFDEFSETYILNKQSFLTSDAITISDDHYEDCYKRYVVNYKEGNRSFDSKIDEQFEGAELGPRLVFAHAQWLWTYAVQDKRTETKKGYAKHILRNQDVNLREDIYPFGFGSAGQWHNQNKYNEILFCLILLQVLREKNNSGEIENIQDIKEYTEKFCLFVKYSSFEDELAIPKRYKEDLHESKTATANILLYIVKPDDYEPIASDNHKSKIVSSFSSLVPLEESEFEDYNTDQIVLKIRHAISEYLFPDFDFYNPKLRKVWNYGSTEADFNEIQALEYKKAIILYGPPGTSKTHSAKQLATTLITKYFLKDKNNVESFLKNDDKHFLEGRIHHLQLHSNYTYEDFVAGMQLKENETKPVRGKLFEICDMARKDKMALNENDDIPHVLILDEINRVDLSQLFGEVFSALENREEPIEVGVSDFELSIPNNLYVIGTMNEIDFSLERIDFALRRRFLWYEYSFDEEILKEMLKEKYASNGTTIREEEMERFIQNAKQLNKKLAQIDVLGKQYQIGHTFFAEIADIYHSFLRINQKSRLNQKIYRKNGPIDILWDISIEPMIRSFLGSMDEKIVEKELNELNEILLKE